MKNLVIPFILLLTACNESKLTISTSGDSKVLMFGNEEIYRSISDIVSEEVLLKADETVVLSWTIESRDGGIPYYAMRKGSGQSFVVKKHSGGAKLKPVLMQAHKGYFDEASELGGGLYIVEFKTQVLETYKKELRQAGVVLLEFMPENSFVVDMKEASVAEILSLSYVAAVRDFLPAYKISADIPVDKEGFAASIGEYMVGLFGKASKDSFVQKLESIGVEYHAEQESGPVSFVLSLTGSQLLEVVRFKEVNWIQKPAGVEFDMENVLIQGGAKELEDINFVPGEVASYTGYGITGHILEGIDPNHPDFASTPYRHAPIGISDPRPTSHGHATFGIVFGSGAGRPSARGLMPNGQGFYTNSRYVNSHRYNPDTPSKGRRTRYELVKRLIDEREIMFQTASWGGRRTLEYNLNSAEMDRLILELDIPITQSQSNSQDQMSRPQAWSKNIISVGGVRHNDTADPSDDYWKNTSSIGPAADGRIKPDLCAYNDVTETTALYDGYRQFGGTSGATPIVAGHLGLVLEMWTDGLFGNELPFPGEARFYNRPHAATAKALMINSAAQYEFEGDDHDLTRVHQGWGFPNLMNLYNSRKSILVVNEDDILTNLDSTIYKFEVDQEQSQFQATMVYNDPPANISATIHRINNLDLKVTAPDGTVYFGNNGLKVGNFSTPGGEANKIDTVENVIIAKPMVGTWTVEVIADEVNVDAHLETEEVDADYGLVVSSR